MEKSVMLEKMRCNIPPSPDFQDNIEIIDVTEPGYVHFTMDIPACLGNYHGGIHGGTGYCIGEIGSGFATFTLGSDNVCQSASINFFKAVPCCKVDVTTEPIHAGRSTAVIRVTTREAPTGKLLFQSTHNMFLLGPIEG
ncbi:MAG TPA: PaaI family thioesterase [Slackia equolifaciens]|uniref:PaaI family thioesterase n=1 Tax=Slackia equolifaciens TaxID=498718 RepID=A0A9D2UYZ2_9ACTN|nr:PaaI family thioesterase [Slackia equolifaciens]